MADRPIIFSAPMIRALLDGRKTQTRRLLKAKSGIAPARRVERIGAHWIACEYDRKWPIRPPYTPGDRLWVREAWAPNEVPPGGPIYRADYDGCSACQTINLRTGTLHSLVSRWRSPIHMPRWASRLTMTVTDVRVQQLREISEADAIAEGIPPAANSQTIDCDTPRPSAAFRSLWNSIHGPEAWDANPWVAAITFTVERRNIDTPTTDEATK